MWFSEIDFRTQSIICNEFTKLFVQTGSHHFYNTNNKTYVYVTYMNESIHLFKTITSMYSIVHLTAQYRYTFNSTLKKAPANAAKTITFFIPIRQTHTFRIIHTFRYFSICTYMNFFAYFIIILYFPFQPPVQYINRQCIHIIYICKKKNPFPFCSDLTYIERDHI